jgi:subtilisin family serine protease
MGMMRRCWWMSLVLVCARAFAAPESAREIILRFDDPVQIAPTLWRLGLQDGGRLGENPQWVRAWSAKSVFRQTLDRADALPGVAAFDGNLHVNELNAFVPDDPLFAPVFDGIILMYPGQWALKNGLGNSFDINVTPAWNNDWTGQGVKVANIDDGVEVTHPDLVPNLDLTNSFDFDVNSTDPVHKLDFEGHGTCTAGIMAARGGNGTGVTGVAPYATVAGLRAGFTTGAANLSSQLAAATLFRSSGDSREIRVKNHSYGPGSPFVDVSLEYAALTDSVASGTIHCFAAGNGRGSSAQDSGKRMTATHPDVIAVGAIDLTGTFASYSNFGANLTCVAPSKNGNLPAIISTDRLGDLGYNGVTGNNNYGEFGGTSAATPLVAGVMALLKQSNPSADGRLARHLIARTARVVNAADTSSASDGGWRTNAAGFKFNPNFGFGLMDAGALMTLAQKWTGTTPRLVLDSGEIPVNRVIPDNNATGINGSATFSTPQRIEGVRVRIRSTHPRRGHLIIRLTSPSGYGTRICAGSSSDTAPDMDWTFLALPQFGEIGNGTWTVNVRDGLAGSEGTWNSVSIQLLCGEPTTSNAVQGTVGLGEAVVDGRAVSGHVRAWYPGDRSQALASIPVTLAPGQDPNQVVLSALGNLPEGTFDLELSVAPYLRKRVRNVNTAQPISGLRWDLTPGDANGNGEVDILDYIRLCTSFGSEVGMEGFDDAADMDRDGLITILDYLILSSNYGLSGD